MGGRALRPTDIIAGIRPMLASIKRHARQSGSFKGDHHAKIGICVSGGPDSMALAHLIQNLPVVEEIKLDPLAIIVDHRVRRCSTQEALQVQAELQRLGIASNIINMPWPAGSDPLRWSNFESEARVRRYRIIALTAIRNQLNHVLTGHHMDDQVETGMMRLAFQQHETLLGLRGVPLSSSLPCCDEIQGTHEGESFWPCGNRSQIGAGHPIQMIGKDTFDVHLPAEDGHTFFRPGGLRLHRPLLPFLKADLVATCEQNSIPFVTDITNSDPSVTRRNAVRVLRTYYQLPKALSSPRILQLQEYAEAQVQRCLSHGLRFLQSFLIRKLDLASGTIVVEFPLLQNLDTDQSRGLSNAVARLIAIVTPCGRDEIPMQVPELVMSHLFPTASVGYHEGAATSNGRIVKTSFNFLRTQFVQHGGQKNVWTIHRQPMRSSEIISNSMGFVPETIDDTRHSADKRYFSKWKLWDGRFWIRISCNDRQDLEDCRVHALSEGHIQQIRSGLRQHEPENAKSKIAMLNRSLKASAPSKIRFTLPVLELRDRIIELPTLRLNFTDSLHSTKGKVWSEICYKTIEGMDQIRLVKRGAADEEVCSLSTKLGDVLGLCAI